MWRRFQSHTREKERQIGHPVLVETTYDENQLKQIPDIGQAQHASHYYNHQPPQHDLRDSVTSAYSQPDHSMAPDISPPSSPEPDERYHDPNQPRRFRSMRDVSPVDENRRPLRSNIPVMRKMTLGLGIRESPPRIANRPARVSSRPVPSEITFSKPREPWKGASGRAEIVEPMRDQPTERPFQYQRNIDSRTPGGRSVSGPAPSTFQRPAPVRNMSQIAESPTGYDAHSEYVKPVVPLKAGRNSPPRNIVLPVTSHDAANFSYAAHPALRTHTRAATEPSAEFLGTFLTESPPTVSIPGGRDSWEYDSADEPTTPTNMKPPQNAAEDTPGSTASRDRGPTSRFSWTTYNTSTTYQHSPPPSPPPPLPTAAANLVQQMSSSPAAPSIMNRGHPLPSVAKATTRKPVSVSMSLSSGPPTIAPSESQTSPSSPRPASTFSTATATTTNTTNTQKALPRPPTEVAAADHVDILEAQMEDLNVRRSNVHRLLQDLHNMAPPNPLVTNFKRMRLVEQRKKEYEDELAEIKREEHDVGLRLHRAYRKRDRAEGVNESALWIRRVTG